MKSVTIILLLSFKLYSQLLLYGDDELFFYQDNGFHTYHFTPLCSVWDYTGILRTFDKYGHSVSDPLKLTLNGYIYEPTNSNGMDYILSSEQGWIPVFGNSIYKVGCYSDTNCVVEEAAFFLDIRDCGHGYPGIGYNDFTIKYLSSQKKFYIVEGKGVDFNDSRFVEVTNKIVRLWDVEPITWSGIGCYADFWENCAGIGTAYLQPFQVVWGQNPDQNNISKYYLYRKIDAGNFTKIGEFNNQTFSYKDNSLVYDYIVQSSSTVSYRVTSFNGTESTPTNIATQEYYFEFNWSSGLILTISNTHPKLIWVPNTSFSPVSYRIYRAVSNYPTNPLLLNYSLVSTVSSSTFEYIDYAVTVLPGYQYAYYYVVGWNGSSESSKTNYVYTPAEFHKLSVEIPKENSLGGNYPNPFNPITTITYDVKDKGLVNLSVYDILGKEVANLVNENKDSGRYSVSFDASDLRSGVYIYTLRVNDFSTSKKMVVLK